MKIDLTISASAVDITAVDGKSVSLYIRNADLSAIVAEIGIAELLDEIGETEAKDHFGIEDPEGGAP